MLWMRIKHMYNIFFAACTQNLLLGSQNTVLLPISNDAQDGGRTIYARVRGYLLHVLSEMRVPPSDIL
jgi:hypothetical protein